MNTKKKVWGVDRTIFSKNCTEVHHMHLSPCASTGCPVKCSTHVHAVKHNLFHVLDGALTIVTMVEGQEYEHTLGVGEQFHVYPGIKHYFRVDVPAEILEFVWAEDIPEDIHRDNEGCVLKDGPK